MSNHDTTGLQSTAGTTDALHPDCPAAECRQLVRVAGGLLVFEDAPDHVGRTLVGVAAVESRPEIADALAARGLGRGAAYYLPEFDLTPVAEVA